MNIWFMICVVLISLQANTCAERPLLAVSAEELQNRIEKEKQDKAKHEQALELKINRAAQGNQQFGPAALAFLAKTTQEHLEDLDAREGADEIQRVSGWFVERTHGLLVELGYPVKFGKTPVYSSLTDDEDLSAEYPLVRLGTRMGGPLHAFAGDEWSIHLSRNFYEAARRAFDPSYYEDVKNGNVVPLTFTLSSFPCRVESQVPCDLMRQMYTIAIHYAAHHMNKVLYEQQIIGSDISQSDEEKQSEAAITNPEMIAGALAYLNLSKLQRTYVVWLHKITPPCNLNGPFDIWLLRNNTRVNESCNRYHAKVNGAEYNPVNYHQSDDDRITGFSARLPEPLGDRIIRTTVFRGGEVFKKLTLSEGENFRIKAE